MDSNGEDYNKINSQRLLEIHMRFYMVVTWKCWCFYNLVVY